MNGRSPERDSVISNQENRPRLYASKPEESRDQASLLTIDWQVTIKNKRIQTKSKTG
ncbi:MAG: hypothetical protein WC382_07605 [Methanoregulaceae archaeon]|jgi:hypothetical protein